MSHKLTLTAIETNAQRLDGGAMFGNAPRALWQRWTDVDERGRIPLACRALLVEYKDQKVLLEAGIGTFFEPKLADRYGVQEPDCHLLRENLEKKGYHENDIDYVILSHLHFDHAGGLLPSYHEIQNGHDRLLFARAQYLVGKEAFERAENPHPRDKASFIPGLADKLKQSGRLQLVSDTRSPIFPEIFEFWFSYGHTPGQMHTKIHTSNTTVFFAGDLVPGTAWVNLPITMGYDRFPEKLIDEKKTVYERAQKENWYLYYTHDPQVITSQIHQDEKGRFRPTQEKTELEKATL